MAPRRRTLTRRSNHGLREAVLQLTSDMSTRRHLRSAATPTLGRPVVPSIRRTTLGDRAFPVAAARAWNALPSSL